MNLEISESVGLVSNVKNQTYIRLLDNRLDLKARRKQRGLEFPLELQQ